MANLAIKGHATRGKEVIKLLEMLGGKNRCSYFGESESYAFYIIDEIIDCDEIRYLNDYIIFTLEQFLEKFPYKVGDRVKVPYEDGRITGNDLYEYKILKIKWDDLESTIKYGLPTGDEQRIEYYSTDNLNIWNKKETMEEIIKIDIPKGYEFAGIDDDNQQVVFEKIGCRYPKTYEECCEVLGYSGNYNMILTTDVDNKLFDALYRLKVCRDAYWKIAGDWKPEFRFGKKKYSIMTKDNKVISATVEETNRILVFPTEEMRGAFYENFKDLIEQCKELL